MSRSPNIYDETDSGNSNTGRGFEKVSDVDQIIDVFKQKLHKDRSKPKLLRHDSFVSEHEANERNYGMFDAKHTEIPSIIRVPNEQAKRMRS